MGTSRVQEQRKGQVMVEIAITLGPNCKKSEHNWAFIERGETCEVDLQFLEVILHANSMQQPTIQIVCYKRKHSVA